MNKLAQKSTFFIVALITIALLSQGIQPVAAQTNNTILWMVGLGTGDRDAQVKVENKVVDEFNQTVGKKNHITLQIKFGVGNSDTAEAIKTMLAAGNAPDIAGPVGVAGSNEFADQWLDLKPLIDKTNYDLTGFTPALLNLYQTLNNVYSAIPFGVYPTVIFYNAALFDAAGLKYPPTKAGEKYTMPDGSQVNWDFTTLSKIAKLLTLDKSGNNATSDKFDPKNMVQAGLDFGAGDMRPILSDIQPSLFYDPATNIVKISDDWRTAAHWLWSGIWKEHFISGTTDFSLAQSAMMYTPLWNCCFADVAGKLNWNLGVVPQSLDGKTHVVTDADTFRIFKTTKNPDAAFIVLSYLLDDAVPELAPIYGSFPARTEYQQAWIDSENKAVPQRVNWRVATDSLQFTNPASLHHESNTPNFQQVEDRFAGFRSLLFGDGGATLDIDKELDKLQADLQSIVNGTFPTPTPQPTAAS